MKRYQAIDYSGNLLAVGNTIAEVQGPGDRILVDYKMGRYAHQGFYPVWRETWHWPLGRVGDILRGMRKGRKA